MRSPSTHAAPVPRWLGALAAPIYCAAMARRNAAYDAGRGVQRLDRPVISVGNLSVGGTGKTPMVARVVRTLLDAGVLPCIAMRGYAPRTPRRTRTASDEAAEHAAAFPGVPIVARVDRLSAVRALLAEPAGERVGCVVLDDGFQHRRIARDLDLVLIDATRDPFADRPLPAGWLREPTGSLRRATHVVVTHAEAVPATAVDALCERVTGVNAAAALGVCRHEWRGLVSAADTPLPVEWLAGRRVAAVCAIGNPGAFLRQARAAAGTPDKPLATEIVLRDHDPYAPRTVNRLLAAARRAGAQAVLTTEKDWSKLRRVPRDRWPCPVVRPRLDLVFERGAERLAADILRVCGR